MANEDVKAHCAEINLCNQRGGRMLSIVDLLRMETLDLDTAAFLAERISSGASFIVGAGPGGAGKTTVMSALINFIPAGMPIIHAENRVVLKEAEDLPPSCVICHEIGEGSYYSYLRGEDLAAYLRLKKFHHILASNIHADTYEEAGMQICVRNRVPEWDLGALDLLIFISLEGSWPEQTRRISSIWMSRQESRHELVFSGGLLRLPSCVDKKRFSRAGDLLRFLVQEDVYMMEEVRKKFVEAVL